MTKGKPDDSNLSFKPSMAEWYLPAIDEEPQEKIEDAMKEAMREAIDELYLSGDAWEKFEKMQRKQLVRALDQICESFAKRDIKVEIRSGTEGLRFEVWWYFDNRIGALTWSVNLSEAFDDAVAWGIENDMTAQREKGPKDWHVYRDRWTEFAARLRSLADRVETALQEPKKNPAGEGGV